MANPLSPYKVIRVTPTLDTSAYGTDEVLFNATEIPNAVYGNGGCSRLVGVSWLNEDDVASDIYLVFMQVQSNLGTINAAVGSGSLWTNALAKAAKPLGHIKIDNSDNTVDLVNNLLYTSGATGGPVDASIGLPMHLQAEADSTSVYVAGITVNGEPTCAADDYEFIFYIEYY